MRIHITARHLKLTPAIRSYVEEKVQKAQKYFSRITWVQVVLSVEKRTHRTEIVIHAAHQTLRALAQGQDLYAAIDLASDKIDAQLKKYKDRLRDHHARQAQTPIPPTFIPSPDMRFSVVKQVSLKPMTREEAVQEMEALGYSFWLFLDREDRQLQVVFRRLDDTYGILRPLRQGGR
ncbi:MAG: ribosome-associated translation inhibitor RaiA [Elusimicrobia bacterium]|nr:ribosome-associated translation inhibitor RaiA [Elusimicrobiota bacterium]